MIGVVELVRGGILACGYIPTFLDEADPRPAQEQFDERYVSGWHPLPGWQFDARRKSIQYPDDPVLVPLAVMRLRNQKIYVYRSAWVAIVDADGAYEVARMD